MYEDLDSSCEAPYEPDLDNEPTTEEKLWDAEREIETLREKLRQIVDLADIGNLFDGHDELNEYTHIDNTKHMTSALNRIYEIASGRPRPTCGRCGGLGVIASYDPEADQPQCSVCEGSGIRPNIEQVE